MFLETFHLGKFLIGSVSSNLNVFCDYLDVVA